MNASKRGFWRRRVTVLAGFGPLLCLLSCSLDGHDISIGRSEDAINLDLCYPAGARCTSDSPDVVDSAFDEPGACSQGKRLEPTYYSLPELPEGFKDRLVARGFAAASPDGSFWYLAVGYPKVPNGELPMHLFLYQIGQHAEEVGKVGIPVTGSGDFAPQMSLSVDGDGTATVALNDGAIAFHRFESGAKPAGVSGSLRPLPNQLFAEDSPGHYVVAGGSPSFDTHGILSRVTIDGRLERSSNRIPDLNGGSGLIGLTSQNKAGYSLLAKTPDMPGSYRVLRYDRELEPQWALSLPRSLPFANPSMVSDARGRLLVAELFGEDAPPAVGLYAAGVDGTALFSFLLPSSGDQPDNLLMTVQRGASKAWVHFDGVNLESKSEAAPHYLAEVDLQAASCTVHESPALEAEAQNDLLVAPDGTLFLLTDSALVRLDEVAEE